MRNRCTILTILSTLAVACGTPFDPADGNSPGLTIEGAVEVTGASWLADEYAYVTDCLGTRLDMNHFQLGRFYLAESIVLDGRDLGGVTSGEYMYALRLDGRDEITRAHMRHEMLHYLRPDLSHEDGSFETIEHCDSRVVVTAEDAALTP